MKSANELNRDYELRRRVSASWTPEQASPACSKQERGQIKKNVSDMRKLVIITVQVGLLALINFAGHLIAAHLFFSRLPGNLVGMLLLFAMLSSRVIPLAWVQEAASVLTRHFAFFFIPLAVGLIAFKGLFLQHGLPILGTLIFSAACGMFLCGSVAQLTDQQGAKNHEIAAARIRHWYHRIGIRR
jgi:holin-like protein